MRWVICAVSVVALAPSAHAGDFDVLRGAEPTYHWGGVYGGVQGGYTSSVVDAGSAVGPDLAKILRITAIESDEQVSNWAVLSSRTPTSVSVGGFVGYNFEWEDLILGVEADYDRMSLSASSANSITRSFSDSGDLPAGHNYYYTITVGGGASLQMNDVATFRARAGWEAGRFLPYAFAGLALGRASISSIGSVSGSAVDYPDSEIPPLTPLPNLTIPLQTQGNAQNGVIAYGATMGLGVDIALLPNWFVRAEFEHIYFAPVDGIQVSVSSARVGAGYKF
jgi:opacity protein-like surface antigen